MNKSNADRTVSQILADRAKDSEIPASYSTKARETLTLSESKNVRREELPLSSPMRMCLFTLGYTLREKIIYKSYLYHHRHAMEVVYIVDRRCACTWIS